MTEAQNRPDMSRAPGLRLHPRTQSVALASADLRLQLIAFQDEHDLTDIEMLRCLAEHSSRITTWLLRRERHPDDPDRKADEA